MGAPSAPIFRSSSKALHRAPFSGDHPIGFRRPFHVCPAMAAPTMAATKTLDSLPSPAMAAPKTLDLLRHTPTTAMSWPSLSLSSGAIGADNAPALLHLFLSVSVIWHDVQHFLAFPCAHFTAFNEMNAVRHLNAGGKQRKNLASALRVLTAPSQPLPSRKLRCSFFLQSLPSPHCFAGRPTATPLPPLLPKSLSEPRPKLSAMPTTTSRRVQDDGGGFGDASALASLRGQSYSAQPLVKKLFKGNTKSSDDRPCGHSFLSSQFHGLLCSFAGDT
ncbi:hypothetical protein ABZP36_013322 [Zizania latifolia]